jgi:hypothetical protein
MMSALRLLLPLLLSTSLLAVDMGLVHLKADRVLDHSMVVSQKNLTLEGRVMGDCVQLSGQAHIRGTIDGDLVAIFSQVEIEPQAKIAGKIISLGSTIAMNESMRVHLLEIPFYQGFSPHRQNLAGTLFRWLLLAFFLFLCSTVSLKFAPKRMRIAALELREEPFEVLFVGILGGALAGLLLFALILNFSHPLAFFGFMVLLAICLMLLVFGTLAIVIQLGQSLQNYFLQRASLVHHLWMVSLLLAAILSWQPLGAWVEGGILLLALGVSLTSRLGSNQSWLTSWRRVWNAR